MTPPRPSQVATTGERLSILETSHAIVVQELVDIRLTLRDILERLHARPSWAVTAYLTIVTALATGLLGYVLRGAAR